MGARHEAMAQHEAMVDCCCAQRIFFADLLFPWLGKVVVN
jgi:hypothetical protein